MSFRRFAPALALSVLAACTGEIGAASSTHRQDVIRMGNKGPFYGRDDGLGFMADDFGPALITNGEIDQMIAGSLYNGDRWDFLGDTVIPTVATPDGSQGPWVETSTNQTTSAVQKADWDDGAIELLVDNGNEVGDIDLYWGDESNIDSDTEPFCIFRVQIQTAPVAADTLAWGLYGAQNDLIESTTNNAYFGVAGADLNLDAASDDNTTDVDNTDTTVDVTADTWIETMISMNSAHGRTASDLDGASATDVHFFYRTSLGGAWTQVLPNTTFSVGADVALQPFVHVEKTAGTSTPDLLVDYVGCYWKRS